LIFQAGKPPIAQYRFKHALVQDAAYQSLLTRDRRKLHQRIYQSLDRWPTIVSPSIKALHAQEAGLISEAIAHLRLAADVAVQTSSNEEALALFDQALLLFEQIPANPKTETDLLDLLVTRGIAVIAHYGYPATEVEDNYLRARDLAAKVPNQKAEFAILRGLWNCYFDRADHQTAWQLAEELIEKSARADDAGERAAALRAAGSTAMLTGRFAAAEEYLVAGAAISTEIDELQLRMIFGENPMNVCSGYLGMTLACTGRIDEGLAMLEEAVVRAEKTNQPIGVAFAMSMWAITHSNVGNVEEANLISDRILEICRDNHLVFWNANNNVIRGWANAHIHGQEEYLELLREGIRAWENTRAVIFSSRWFWLLADAYFDSGDMALAEETVTKAREIGTRVGEDWCAAEHSRLLGRIRLAENKLDQARALFREAVETARPLGATTFELAALIDLIGTYEKIDRRSDLNNEFIATLAEFDGQTQSKFLSDGRRLKSVIDGSTTEN
jgi:tetratricopeptide (TPR) repeat protein